MHSDSPSKELKFINALVNHTQKWQLFNIVLVIMNCITDLPIVVGQVP